MASADYDYDGERIAQEFRRNLDTGVYGYTGDGDPYECAMMQRYDMTSDRPLNELFGAWWLGAFCSDPDSLVLIDNLAPAGVLTLLCMAVRGCAGLEEEAAPAAHAALPFVRFVRSRIPYAEEASFNMAVAALEAIESQGAAASTTEPYVKFMEKAGELEGRG